MFFRHKSIFFFCNCLNLNPIFSEDLQSLALIRRFLTLGCDVTLFYLTAKENIEKETPDFKLACLEGLQFKKIICKPIPTNRSYIKRWLQDALKEGPFDLIFIDAVSNIPFIDSLQNIKKCIYIKRFESLIEIFNFNLKKRAEIAYRKASIKDFEGISHNLEKEMQVLKSFDYCISPSMPLLHTLKSFFHSKLLYFPPQIVKSCKSSDYSRPPIMILNKHIDLHGYYYFIDNVLNALREENPLFYIHVLGRPSYIAEPVSGMCSKGYIQNLDEYFKKAKFFISPKKINYTLELEALKAMSFGLAVLGFENSHTIPFVENNYNGFIASNSFEMQNVIKRLYSNPNLIREWGRNAKKTAKKYITNGEEVFQEVT